MKTLKITLLPLLLAALLANSAAAADAKPVAKPEAHPARVRPIEQLKQQLSLSDEQVKSIQNIHKESRANAIDERKKSGNDEFKGFYDLAPDSKEYSDMVAKIADQSATRARNNLLNMAENRKKVYGILNAEQQKKFLAMKPRQHQALNPKRKGEKPAVE